MTPEHKVRRSERRVDYEPTKRRASAPKNVLFALLYIILDSEIYSNISRKNHVALVERCNVKDW